MTYPIPVRLDREVSSSSSWCRALAATPAAAALATGVIFAAPAAAETLSTDEVAGVVESAGLPCVSGTAVALAESGGNTRAVGPAGEVGLFQIHPTHGQSGMRDPYANAAFAAELYRDAGGWAPDWAAYTNGSYRQYLDEARAACGGATPEPEPQEPPEPQGSVPEGPTPDSESASASEPTGATYEVVRGDTLSELAAERDTSAEHLHEMNADRIDDPDLIYVGQTLDVSGHPKA